MQLLTSRSSCQALHVSHSWICAASVCTNMFVILIACAILCRWLSCSHYGYHSWNRTEAGLMQAICMCDTTQNNRHTAGGFFVFHKSFVVLSYHVTLKVPINNHCIKEFHAAPRIEWCTTGHSLSDSWLFSPQSEITAVTQLHCTPFCW